MLCTPVQVKKPLFVPAGDPDRFTFDLKKSSYEPPPKKKSRLRGDGFLQEFEQLLLTE